MRWKRLPGNGLSKNIEDRRGDSLRPDGTRPVPSAPDALLRGMPQTKAEFDMYKEKLRQEAAYRAGIMPQPKPEPMFPDMVVPATPSKGDPAGLETHRAAILARMQADQATLAEIDTRLGAMKKAPKR